MRVPAAPPRLAVPPYSRRVPLDFDARQLLAEQVEAAKAMAPEDRLLEGLRLFDRACRMMRAGIRHRHPGATEREVLELLERQLAIVAAREGRRDQR